MDNNTVNGNVSSANESSEATKIIEASILCFIIVAAVFGNVSIWLIIITSRALRTTTNMFILGLSAADLLVSVANMPSTVVSVITGSWPLSKSACVVFGFINMLTLVTSVLSLCNISINRYFMVCRPYKFTDIYTKRNACLMIAGVVTLSVILSSPPFFGWGEYAYIPIQSFCFCDWANHLSYAIFMICCCFGGPCSVMTVCNILIYRTVRASKIKIENPEPPEKVNEKTKHQGKDRPDSESDGQVYSEIISDRDNVESFSEENDDIDGIDHNDKCVNTGGNDYEKSNNSVYAVKTLDLNADKFIIRDSRQCNNRKLRALSSVYSRRASTSSIYKRLEEHRLAMSLIVVVIVFVICWLPYCVSMLLSIFFKGSVPREFHMFTLIIGYANSCCNPIIYGLMNRRFAAGFKRLYCSCTQGNDRLSSSA